MLRSSYIFLIRGDFVPPAYTKPAVWRITSCTQIGRFSGTSPLAVSTFKSFNSGSHFVIGSLRPIFPCSTIIMAATVTMGLVIEASRNKASLGIGLDFAASKKPCASLCTTTPLRATIVTAPGNMPVRTCSCIEGAMRAKRSLEKPWMIIPAAG